MEKITISLHNSGTFKDIQIEHDNRLKNENGIPYYSDNVNPEMSHLNYYDENNISIKEFYEKEFENEYQKQQERNVKSGHKSRNKYNSYYEEILDKQLKAEEKVKELKKQGVCDIDIKRQLPTTTKVAYQTILSLGDKNGPFRTIGNSEQQIKLGVEILKDFIENQQKLYPNMKIVNFSIHADENGGVDKLNSKNGETIYIGSTVHAHITWVPVSETYKTGMLCRNSLTKALEENNFVNDKVKNENGKMEFAIEKWQQKMRDDLNEHIKQYGYERIAPEETRTKHQDTKEYQKQQDQNRKYEVQQKEIAENKAILNELKAEQQQFNNSHDDLIKLTQSKGDEVLTSVDILKNETMNEFRSFSEDLKNSLTTDIDFSKYKTEERRTKIVGGYKEKVVIVPFDDFKRIQGRLNFNKDKIKKDVENVLNDSLRRAEKHFKSLSDKVNDFFSQFKTINDYKLNNFFEDFNASQRFGSVIEKQEQEIETLKKQNKSLKEEIELNNEITNSIKNCPDKDLVERVKLDLARLMELTKKKDKLKQQTIEIESGFERER